MIEWKFKKDAEPQGGSDGFWYDITVDKAREIVKADSYGLEGLPSEREFYFAKGLVDGWDRSRRGRESVFASLASFSREWSDLMDLLHEQLATKDKEILDGEQEIEACHAALAEMKREKDAAEAKYKAVVEAAKGVHEEYDHD